MLKRRILLLEDHDDTRVVMARLLRRLGHDVFARASSEDAVQHIDECDAEVAILDVRLPGRAGDDFARELRQRCPRTHIIFITAEADVKRLRREVPGAFALRKPIDLDVLMQILDGLPTHGGGGDGDGSGPWACA